MAVICLGKVRSRQIVIYNSNLSIKPPFSSLKIKTAVLLLSLSSKTHYFFHSFKRKCVLNVNEKFGLKLSLAETSCRLLG